MLARFLRYSLLIVLCNPLLASTQLSIVVVDAFGTGISAFRGTLKGKSTTQHFTKATQLFAQPGDYELIVECTGFVTARMPIRLGDQPVSSVVALRVGSLAAVPMPPKLLELRLLSPQSSCDTAVLSPVFMTWAPSLTAPLVNNAAKMTVSEFGLYVASVIGPSGPCKASVVTINAKTTILEL